MTRKPIKKSKPRPKPSAPPQPRFLDKLIVK